MTLPHLLIGVAALLPGLFLAAGAIRWTGDETLGLGAAALALAAWPSACWGICRILRYPPLFLFASPCPGCGVKPPGYGLDLSDWPRARLGCPLCGRTFDVWMIRRPPPERLERDTPAYALRWPEFAGRWRRVN